MLWENLTYKYGYGKLAVRYFIKSKDVDFEVDNIEGSFGRWWVSQVEGGVVHYVGWIHRAHFLGVTGWSSRLRGRGHCE